MQDLKFTGVNIAAVILILAYFFPWCSTSGSVPLSGFSISTNGIWPGMLGMYLTGIDRVLMVFILVVPISGAVILYQNVTGNQKFARYYKVAHIVPAAVLIAGMLGVYFKIETGIPGVTNKEYYETIRGISAAVKDMTPGLFDILATGVYISLTAGIYILLVITGKVKDKEYYKPGTTVNINKVNSN